MRIRIQLDDPDNLPLPFEVPGPLEGEVLAHVDAPHGRGKNWVLQLDQVVSSVDIHGRRQSGRLFLLQANGGDSEEVMSNPVNWAPGQHLGVNVLVLRSVPSEAITSYMPFPMISSGEVTIVSL